MIELNYATRREVWPKVKQQPQAGLDLLNLMDS